jgi:5'-phosphate synthase pdxT subunit
MLGDIGVDSPEIRLPWQLNSIDGLIIPGGESTTIVQLIDIYDFRTPLAEKAKDGLPMWGTCAGMIVLAKSLSDHRPEPLQLMDIDVSRNAFGRQVDSFEAGLDIEGIKGDDPYVAVFIRAPVVDRVGSGVEILAELDDGRPVAVRQNALLATSFHPELTQDTRIHEFFLKMVENTSYR